jgi:hypothetical protein
VEDYAREWAIKHQDKLARHEEVMTIIGGNGKRHVLPGQFDV